MSVSGNAEDQCRVKILRDTACSQSLIPSSMLPLNTRSDESAVVRGIEMGLVPAPLHRVYVSSEFLSTINGQLSYLSVPQKQDVIDLFRTYTSVLDDVPNPTSVLSHDIDVSDASSIKQHAYRCPPAKREAMRKEECLVKNGFAKPSCSP